LLVINILLGRSDQLIDTLSCSPSFEENFIFTTGASAKEIGVRVRSTNTADCLSRDPMFRCLLHIAGNPEDELMWDPAALFGLYDDLLTTDSSEAGRLENRLLHDVSDLEALYELLRPVRLQKPLTQNVNIDDALSVRQGVTGREKTNPERRRDQCFDNETNTLNTKSTSPWSDGSKDTDGQTRSSLAPES
jgi:hypothetical protein